MSLLIKNATLVSMDETREKIEENIEVFIEGGRITEIGKKIEKQADEVIDAKNRVLMP